MIPEGKKRTNVQIHKRSEKLVQNSASEGTTEDHETIHQPTAGWQEGIMQAFHEQPLQGSDRVLKVQSSEKALCHFQASLITS